MVIQDIIIVAVEGDIVLLNVSVQIFSSENLSDSNQLIVVVFTLEEWLLLEDHTSKHASKWPNIKGVVIGLQINK